MANKYHSKKCFGQHFLNDQKIIQTLLQYINPKQNQQFIEIGPGRGAITFPLLKQIKSMQVIEIDRDLIKYLQQQGGDKLLIHNKDALKFDFNQLVNTTQQLRIVGNLPYNISTALIFHLMKYTRHIKDMHFMLQKEVVDRITAKPNSKIYGRLSVMVQYYCATEYLFSVAPRSFRPPPKVNSAVLRLQPWQQKPHQAKHIKLFSQVVTQAFSMRRKTLRNTLKKLLTTAQIEAAGINPRLRPENLTVEDYVKLSNLL